MRLNKPARATFITCESNIYTHLRKCVTAVAEQEELCWFEDFFYDHSKPSSKSAANYNRNVFSCDNYCIQNGGLRILMVGIQNLKLLRLFQFFPIRKTSNHYFGTTLLMPWTKN